MLLLTEYRIQSTLYSVQRTAHSVQRTAYSNQAVIAVFCPGCIMNDTRDQETIRTGYSSMVHQL